MAARTHWATDSPELTERERDTAADKRLYVEIGLVPVQCRECGVEVGVKKNSRKHTSVQWSAAAMAGCTGVREPRLPAVEGEHRRCRARRRRDGAR